ncbi:uncharacterized protein LOC111347017 [Stylophora pistillata]|nr:uncharacterized protein LOC111347017 [Stylophora pistillata]
MAPNKEALSKYQIRAVNLDGAFLGNVVKSGCKENIAVVLAIKDVCGRIGCGFANVPQAIQSIIVNFVRAAVVAGLSKVYPSEPDEEDRETIDIGSSEEEDESSHDEPCDNGQNVAGDDQEHANFYANQQPSTSGSGKPQFKQGTPSDDELEHLASNLGDAWKTLRRRLGIKDPKLEEIRQSNEPLSEQGYQMLRQWKGGKGSDATYQILGQALQHELVNLRELAEEFCYEQQ